MSVSCGRMREEKMKIFAVLFAVMVLSLLCIANSTCPAFSEVNIDDSINEPSLTFSGDPCDDTPCRIAEVVQESYDVINDVTCSYFAVYINEDRAGVIDVHPCIARASMQHIIVQQQYSQQHKWDVILDRLI